MGDKIQKKKLKQIVLLLTTKVDHRLNQKIALCSLDTTPSPVLDDAHDREQPSLKFNQTPEPSLVFIS